MTSIIASSDGVNYAVVATEPATTVVPGRTDATIIIAGQQGSSGVLDPTTIFPSISLQQGAIGSATLVSSVVGLQVLDTFQYTQFGAAKYIIYATNVGDRQISELLLLHDNINVASVEYANIVTASLLGTYSVDIYLGMIRLLVDAPLPGINYKVMRTLINN